ncbi:MAG TPA: serine hydrolase, partial [Gaiellaceae bacterium]|nr:serine hydrolase [Gaiellaceae bacterium]
MSKLKLNITMSIDGFVAGPDQSPEHPLGVGGEELHDWLVPLKAFRESHGEEGVLELSTPVRSVLGSDLPVIDDGVTVEHLLSHRSGIGDYLDEEAVEIEDYVMPVPVHELATTEDYLAVLDGHPSTFAPGERFA